MPFFEERSSIRLLPKETIKSFDDLSFEIPAAFLKQGITEYKEIFKLIVSTGEFDASLLQQDGLKTAQPTRSAVTHQSTLNLLMDRVYSREVVRTARTHDDWMTKAVTVTIARSHDAKPIKPNEPTLLLDGVVERARQGDLQKSVPKSASTQPATQSKKVNPKYQNQKRLSGSVVGAIALLFGICRILPSMLSA